MQEIENRLFGSLYATSACSNEINDTTAVELLAAPGTNIRYLITDVMVTNSNTSSGSLIQILDGDNNVLWQGYAAAESGWSKNFRKPIVVTSNKSVKGKCGSTLATDGAYICIAAIKDIPDRS